MKRKLFKSMIAAGAVAMICACGDDANSSGASDQQPLSGFSSETSNPQNPGLSSAITDPQNPTSSASEPVAANPCNKLVLTSVAWLLNVDTEWLIYPDGRVTDFTGNNVGSYADGVIHNFAGEPVMQGVDLTVLPICQPNATVDPHTGEVTVVSSSSVGGTEPTSSTGTEPVVSSSSVNTDPDLDENGFPTIESYGAPPAEYTKEIRNNGKTGWNSRYWDGCKPHCSWLSSVDTTSEETYQAGRTVARNCNVHDVEVPAFTLGHAVQQYWMGFEGTNSACDTKDPTGTFACTDMAPIAVNEKLSYAYVAGSGKQYQYGCGKCYHLQYNGGKSDGDVKKTHKALDGKHIVVMVSNIGHDVVEGQFDLLVPGGGVGAFDALSTQLGLTDASVLGANGGGIGRVCFEQVGWDGEVADFQKCIIDGCEKAFSKWPNLLRGCKWYAEWYMAADNPTYNWEEVECPQYLIDHYMTTINTTKDNRYRWKDDWSNYKKGDELETQDCLTDEYPKGCGP
jgi:hypothetical protein